MWMRAAKWHLWDTIKPKHPLWKPLRVINPTRIPIFYVASFRSLSISSYNLHELFYHFSSFSQFILKCCFFTLCLFPPKHHRPVPMPTVSGRLFRCTGMEAAEMCHRWQCRWGEELCVWRDAQRKSWVGCRDVYKGELAGARSPRSAQTLTHTHTHTLILQQCFRAKSRLGGKKSKTGSLESALIKQSPQDWILNSSLTDWVLSHFWQFFFFFFFHIRTQICWLQIRHTRFFIYLFIF